MNVKISPALPIFLIALLLTAVLAIMILAIEPTLAGPMRQGGDPLPPGVEPHVIGFDDAANMTNNWRDKNGIWVHHGERSPGEYVQQDADLLAAISLYKRGIEHEYSVEVSLQYLDGDYGGIVFNAPDPGETTVADAIRYNRTLGIVDWGQINADGTFLSVGSTSDGIPSDDEFHTLKVVVAGDGFTAFFDGVQVETSDLTLKSPAYVGVYTEKGSYAFRSMSVTVTEASTPTPTPTATPIPGELVPSDQTYVLGFEDAESLSNWRPALGTWAYDRGYVQSDQNNANAYSYYRRRVKGDYEYKITLGYLGGKVGGGMLFNAPNSTSLVGAMLVGYNPDPTTDDGSILYWGYFDSNSTLQFLGDHIVTPSAIDGAARRLRVQVARGNYSIWLNDSLFLDRKPLPSDVQVENPYVGLYTSNSSVRFGAAQVKVSGYAKPTPTPSKTPTISPTPTDTKIPTETPTPHDAPLTPKPDEYIIGFAATPTNEWEVQDFSRGQWNQEEDGLKQTTFDLDEFALNFYNRTIKGDYVYQATFGYFTPNPPPATPESTETPQPGIKKEGGIVFNSPRRQIPGAFVITFAGGEEDDAEDQIIKWGYLKGEEDSKGVTEDAEFFILGTATGQPLLTDGISRTLKVAVADNHLSIWRDGTPIANRTPFPTDFPRIAEPLIGVYANQTIIKFTDGRVIVSDYTGVDPTPTHAPPTSTPSTTVVVTPRPTRTDTPTPTWTPGIPTATATPVAPSAPPTPTNTPIIINQPPRPTPLPAIVISTPTTKPATQTAIAAAVIAATATDIATTATAIFDQGATATAAALSATQIAAVIPTSPLLSPTPTPVADIGATNTTQANATIAAAQTVTVIAHATMTAVDATASSVSTAVGTTSAVAQAAISAPAATETAAAQTAVAQSVITDTIIDGQPVVVVVATPMPTQRPFEEPPQTPAALTSPVVAFWARIMNAIVTSAAIIWLGVGLAVLIGIAAVLAGIAFQPEKEESPYELHDDLDGAAVAGDQALDEAEIDRILDNLEDEIGAARAAEAADVDGAQDHDQGGGESDGEQSDDEAHRRDRNQGDNWPTSLP